MTRQKDHLMERKQSKLLGWIVIHRRRMNKRQCKTEEMQKLTVQMIKIWNRNAKNCSKNENKKFLAVSC